MNDNSKVIKKVTEQLKKYSIDKKFDSEASMNKWINNLTFKETVNIMSLCIDSELIKFDSNLLINNNLLNTDDYNERVKALASIDNADGCNHLFVNMLTPEFIQSDKFYSDIEKMKKAFSARIPLWIIGDPVFINSPYHDEDFDLLVNYKDERGEEYNYRMMEAIATTARCEASINSPYHQSDINMYLKYGNKVIQSEHTFPKHGINILGTNKVSLNDDYHMDNMEILANNQEIGNFLYAVMSDKKFIHNTNYRKVINKMVEHKNNIEYVSLLCATVIGEEKARLACYFDQTPYIEEFILDNQMSYIDFILDKFNNKEKARDTSYKKDASSENHKENHDFDKKDKKSLKLDFKTWLYLFITKAVKVDHIPVEKVKNKKNIDIKDNNHNEVYIFKDYDEYRDFYLMYLDNVEDDLIDLAIYTKGSKGQIVALKNLCEHIIVKKKVLDFYASITQEQIDEIHSKGKLTPLETVQIWEDFGLCAKENNQTIYPRRCDYFNYNCHDCLMETASHKLEHDNIDFNVTNPSLESQNHPKKYLKYKYEKNGHSTK